MGPCPGPFSEQGLLLQRGQRKGARAGPRAKKGAQSLPPKGRTPVLRELPMTSHKVKNCQTGKPNSCNTPKDLNPVNVHNRFTCLSDLSLEKSNIETSPNHYDSPHTNGKKQNRKAIDRKSNENAKHKLVINLSSKTLSDPERSLLEKGLNFFPTTKRVNAGDQRRDLDTFHNKLGTIQFFQKDLSGTNPTEKTTRPTAGCQPFSDVKTLIKLKDKSNWRAPTGSPALETFITINEISLNKTKEHQIKKPKHH